MSSVADRAVADVLAERARQIEVEGWTCEHDDRHAPGALAGAGANYAINAADQLDVDRDGMSNDDPPDPDCWPGWPWKPKDARRDLVRAAALLIAEIERIDRAAPQQPQPWTRDNDRTLTILSLTEEGSCVPIDAIEHWSDEQCEQAEDWAGAAHFHASDNDDVVVPPIPAHVSAEVTDARLAALRERPF